MDERATRRRVVGTLGAAVGLGLAGCSSNDGDEPSGEDNRVIGGGDDGDGTPGGAGTETQAGDDGEMGGDTGSDDADEWVVTRETADTVVDDDTVFRVEVDGDILVTRDVQLGGQVTASGQVVLEDEVDVDGTVDAGEITVTGGDVEMDGHVDTDGTAILAADIEATRAVHAETGRLERISDLVVSSGVDVEGNVRAGGHLIVGHDSSVAGNLTAGRDGGSQFVVVGRNVDIGGTVQGTADLLLGPDSEVEGDVSVPGTVYLGEDASVEGDVEAERVERSSRADLFD